MIESNSKAYRNAVKQYKRYYNQLCHTTNNSEADEFYLKLCDLYGEINELMVGIFQEKRKQAEKLTTSISFLNVQKEMEEICNEFQIECKHDFILKWLEKYE